MKTPIIIIVLLIICGFWFTNGQIDNSSIGCCGGQCHFVGFFCQINNLNVQGSCDPTFSREIPYGCDPAYHPNYIGMPYYSDKLFTVPMKTEYYPICYKIARNYEANPLGS